MRTDFSINVHVDLGVTPELVALVNAILNRTGQPTAAVMQPQAQPEEPSASDEPEPEPKPKRGRKAKQPEAEPEAEQPEQTDETPEEIKAIEEEQAEWAAENGQKEYTTEDVREAMEQTRIRIEGEDFKNNTESDGYKKYHRALTQQFKLIAATLGADKPSALPAEQIPSFIKQCEELTILEDGNVGVKCPY